MLNIMKLIPTSEDYIYFRNIWGKYNDNTMYISEKIKKTNPELVCIWELNDVTSNDLPDDIIKVKTNTLKSFYLKSRSKIIIDNDIGYITKTYKSDSIVKKMLYAGTKNKKQLNISTWHGTPLKRIFKDIPNSYYNDFFSTTDLIAVGDRHTAKILERATFGKHKIEVVGSPRNDELFQIDKQKQNKLKEKLNLPKEKKVVLFAPTFRSGYNKLTDMYRSGIQQLEQINIRVLLNTLSNKFGGEWVLVYRLHPGVMKEFDTSFLEKEYIGQIYNGNYGNDMTEYLIVSDVLITDYSSSMFDFIITGKPCFLFCPDLDNYEKNERGFYFDIKKLPFSVAEDFKSLLNNINIFSLDDYKIKAKKFLSNVGNADDGCATDRIISVIYKYLNKKE